MLELETRSLPTERLGNAYFSSILADTKARARKDPELLREVLAAADKAAELDGVSARNKVWWPIVKAGGGATRAASRLSDRSQFVQANASTGAPS
ncbi:ABC transporter ATP-binding protein [Myxococcus xanthus]|uniref:ABC transporter ATP-binding protein n=1 Tax=Myxococcus xanthus TaxID=34 RepID=UPI001CEC6991|nr:ABC transporter ATP-binding protein [Myxococcus xanthus]